MTTTNSQCLAQAVRLYFPSANIEDSKRASGDGSDGLKLSQALYPSVSYSDGDEAEINQELTRSAHITADEDPAKRAERMGSLNSHLASRTTLLGSKPSVADVALYARLAPLVKAWTADERTGEYGYHHIVRYVDFVQNSPLVAMSLRHEDKVAINPDQVLFRPKPLDPKQEKERKKKEKTAKVGSGSEDIEPTGNSKTIPGSNNLVERVKDNIKDEVAEAKASVAEGSGLGAASKKEKKKDKTPKPQKQPQKERPLSPAQIDLRVGHILKAVAHPNADSLYVSTIAVGDPPGTDNTSEYQGQVVRTVCSGLNGLIPLEEMQGRKIVAVCNLKPVTMRGIKSAAMVLAASPRLAEGEVDNHAGPVELVDPPTMAAAGDRILFEGWDGEPEAVLNPKKKVWDMCQVGFTTTEDLGVAFDKAKVEQLKGEAGDGRPELGKLVVKGGSGCTVKSLQGAVVR
jgi:aminoacyl tRNA synthase complex-interacting multifunctional protein 1